MLRHTLGNGSHILLNCFVFNHRGHKADLLHLLHCLRATFDVVLLVRLDLTEPDILYVSPTPGMIRAASNLLLDLFVISRPLLNHVELRV